MLLILIEILILIMIEVLDSAWQNRIYYVETFCLCCRSWWSTEDYRSDKASWPNSMLSLAVFLLCACLEGSTCIKSLAKYMVTQSITTLIAWRNAGICNFSGWILDLLFSKFAILSEIRNVDNLLSGVNYNFFKTPSTDIFLHIVSSEQIFWW